MAENYGYKTQVAINLRDTYESEFINNDLIDELSGMHMMDAIKELERLSAENAELRKDKERLDWVVSGTGGRNPIRIQGSAQRGWSALDCSDGLVVVCKGLPTFRDAIDTAMENCHDSGKL